MKFLLFILINLPLCFFGQNNYNQAQISNWFDELVGYDSLGLQNGKIYYDVYFGKTVDDSHVFFRTNKPIDGSITYNGNLYYNLNLKYDTYADEVIYTSKSRIGTMLLIKELITEFTLDQSTFYRLKDVVVKEKSMDGFFELLFDKQNIKLYKKHVKTKKNIIVNDKLRYKFYRKPFYVLKNETYQILNSKRDFKNAFPDHKTIIKKFYKNRLNISLMSQDQDAFMKKLLTLLISNSPEV